MKSNMKSYLQPETVLISVETQSVIMIFSDPEQTFRGGTGDYDDEMP